MQIHRYHFNIIEDYLTQFPAVLVLGARQTGKTTLCTSIASTWNRFDLERDADKQLVSRDPELFLSQYPEKVMIDEAQLLPELFPALRVAIDKSRPTKGRFLLTGSSSPDLISGVSESLAGRVGVVVLDTLKASERFGYPISSLYALLTEVSENKDFITLTGNIERSQLEQFFFEGGFPEVAGLKDGAAQQRWFQSYVATYIDRDLRRLFPRLNIEAYKLFVSMLSHLQGKLINMSDIARGLGISQPTVREYLEIANNTYAWRRINSFSHDTVRRIVKMPKGQYRDCGLANYLLYLNSLPMLRASPLVGWLWEAMIIEELLKGFSTSSIRVEPTFYRTSDGREVDLVLEGPFGLLPIEIKYGMSVSEQELRPIQSFIKERKLSRGIVITNGDIPRLLTDKLIEIPATML